MLWFCGKNETWKYGCCLTWSGFVEKYKKWKTGFFSLFREEEAEEYLIRGRVLEI